MKESAVQASIIRNMERAGWLVNKIIQCTNNGWPDLECHRDGYTLFIEVKKEGEEKRRRDQKRADSVSHGFVLIDILNSIVCDMVAPTV
jgi:hypothetical protein